MLCLELEIRINYRKTEQELARADDPATTTIYSHVLAASMQSV